MVADDAFVMALAHDLRAPLRAIEAYAAALVEDHAGTLPDQAAALLERIRQATLTMDTRVEGLMHLSRLGGQDIQPRRTDLAPVVRGILDDLRRADPGRQVDVVVPDQLVVPGDPALLGIALENLLTNAWKFTRPRPDARITVTLDEETTHVVLSVADNGVGFDMRHVDRLGVPFQRLHGSSAFEGTGIGLASTRRIIERHGGRLYAVGTPGAGATFHMALPSVRAC